VVARGDLGGEAKSLLTRRLIEHVVELQRWWPRLSPRPRASDSWKPHGAVSLSGARLGLPPIAPQAPWRGYSLGLWDAAWDTYAQRAVSGAWEQSGAETFAARRGGLKPETPVRSDGRAGPQQNAIIASA
jgi:hypothetical protein